MISKIHFYSLPFYTLLKTVLKIIVSPNEVLKIQITTSIPYHDQHLRKELLILEKVLIQTMPTSLI